jgi:hypothetical protein
MKPFALALGAAIAAGTPVLAAPPPSCDPSSTPIGSTQTFSPAGAMNVSSQAPDPTSASCSISGALPSSGADRYVVYSTDIRGAAYVFDDDSSASITRDGSGKTLTTTYSGETEMDTLVITDRYAMGKGYTGGFSADYTAAVIGEGALDIDDITVTMAWTTMADQKDSFDQLGLGQAGIVAHLDGMTNLLTGGNLALEGDNEIGILGGVGSYMVGATARANLAPGISLLGGVSLVDFKSGGAGASGVNGALALRYVEPAAAAMRVFGEAGVQVGALNVSLSRAFYDSQTFSSDYEAAGSGDGLLGAVYVRGGVVVQPMPDHEVVVSASLKQSALGLGSYVEDDPLANPNLFAADLSGTSASFTTVKTGVDWTAQLGDAVDLTASGAVGATFGSGVTGTVFGVGQVSGAASTVVFAEYGLRLGLEPAPNSRIDAFVQGTTGTGIGTHAQVGAGYRMTF